MWTKGFQQTGNRVLFMLGQFFVLISCIIYIDYIYLTNIRPDQTAKLTFRQTECFIMSKKLSSKGKFFKRYRADFLVNYNADGAQYHRWVAGNGLDSSYSYDSRSQASLLSDYENGNNYPCWVNPENAEMAVLKFRDSWLSLYGIIFPAVTGLLMLILFIRNAINTWSSR